MSISVGNNEIAIHPATVDGETYFFLPTHASADHLTLYNETGELTPFLQQPVEEEGIWKGVTGNATFYLMRSENIRSLFLFSDDPINQGRDYIDGSENHSTSATASMALISADGQIDHLGHISQLRGRGNGTWQPEKKAYQFKLEMRADLLDTGNPAERNRTWILLALFTLRPTEESKTTFM